MMGLNSTQILPIAAEIVRGLAQVVPGSLIPAEAAGGGVDPIHQFNLHRVVHFVPFPGVDISLSNSVIYMMIGTALVGLFFWAAGRHGALVPNRLQSAGEIVVGMVRDMAVSMIGPEGARFFPFVLTLFTFILGLNFLGLVPGAYTATSQLGVTATLACLSFAVVLIVAFQTHGLGFFGKFFPSGVPIAVMFILVPIEIISFLIRPMTLALRLFGNMLGGHIVLKVFASFVALLFTSGSALALIGIFPLFGAVALSALELLVAGLQAYVFAVLTCVYLNDVLHIDHH